MISQDLPNTMKVYKPMKFIRSQAIHLVSLDLQTKGNWLKLYQKDF